MLPTSDFCTFLFIVLKTTQMKRTKSGAWGILILICFAVTLIPINSCKKTAKREIPSPANQYCVGRVTGTAPGDNQVCCQFLKMDDIVCIPCATTGCAGIWEATRRTRLTSGVCTIVVEITANNDCIDCPENGKVLNTEADSTGHFWQFRKRE